jgi:8-oxo-dGTP pyrophosphatase MutT (NUDIX family)
MLQMYKVFINDKAVVFLLNTEDNLQLYSDLELINLEDATPKKLYLLTDTAHVRGVRIVINNDLDRIFEQWCKSFEWVDAAGGFVLNSSGAFLGIKRLGKWDLPKGKAEPGEDIQTTALREVEEECGINGLKIIRFLSDTYHVYPLRHHYALKCTRWYLMSWDGSGRLKPQHEEGIEAVRWFEIHQRDEFLNNTYASIAEVLKIKF